LNTDKIEEDIAIKSHFKLIIELQKIVDNSSMIKDEPRGDDVSIKTSRTT